MRNRIYILNVLFLFPMWMSKTIQPIFWDVEGKLSLFSASYVAMAVAGTLSFLYAGAIRRLGLKGALITGYLLYGVGLVLRAYPLDLTVAVMTGLISGVGASVTGLALKGLILELNEEQRNNVILHTDNIYTLSQSFGAMISGLLVSLLLIFTRDAYQVALVLTGIISITGVFFVPNNNYKISGVTSKPNKNINESAWCFFKNNKRLYSLVFLSFFLNGACWAVIIPLIPVYLKNMNVQVGTIGVIISLGVIAGLLLKNIYVSLNNKAGKGFSLLAFTLLTSVSVYISLLSIGLNLILLYCGSIIAFYMFKTVLSLITDIIEINIANKTHAMAIFGIRQTAFLTGDVVGGIAMPIMYKNMILINHALWFVACIVLASIMISFCAKMSEKLVWKEA